MAHSKITTNISCNNIAPLVALNSDLNTGNLRNSIFAGNGSGKTFLSRMFRLTEKTKEMVLDQDGNSPTDKFLTIGKDSANFKFKTVNNDKDGNPKEVKEEFIIDFKRGQLPTIPHTQYLYHTFNSDYISDNLRATDYDKDGVIDGFILGKANIDIDAEEKELDSKEKSTIQLNALFDEYLDKTIVSNLGGISHIKGITEYKTLLSSSYIKEKYKDGEIDNIPAFDILLDSFNKIKAVPEKLEDLKHIAKLEDFLELFEIEEILTTSYTLSSLGNEFKEKVKEKNSFISTGVDIINNKKLDNCPFCEQDLKPDALALIDEYNKFLNDVEASITKKLNSLNEYLDNKVLRDVRNLEISAIKINKKYDEYKQKYIASLATTSLNNIDIEEIKNSVTEIKQYIDTKKQNISKVVVFPSNSFAYP